MCPYCETSWLGSSAGAGTAANKNGKQSGNERSSVKSDTTRSMPQYPESLLPRLDDWMVRGNLISTSAFCTLLRTRLEVSDVEQTTPDGNRYGVRTIIGSQLVHEVLNMKVDCSLRDRQLISDLLVTVAVSNESEHLQLTI